VADSVDGMFAGCSTRPIVRWRWQWMAAYYCAAVSLPRANESAAYHFLYCKVLLVTSLAHVSSAISNTGL